MRWFLFALLTMLLWGGADLLYKKSNSETESFSHIKTSICVGLVMGAHAILTLAVSGIDYNPLNLLIYLPVSLTYIISMTVGYFGLKYLELSISSPIQNASGAVVCVLCAVFLHETMTRDMTVAVIFICASIFILGVLEKRDTAAGEKKYTIGFAAFFIPIIYCVIDALGTFFDAYYLDSAAVSPLKSVTEETLETAANVSYELTFLAVSVLFILYLVFVKKERIKPADFKPVRLGAAVFETAGQFTYVYAMSGKSIAAAPMVAAYSVVSLFLSRIFLKEKLTVKKYICIAFTLLGIIILGICGE